MSTTAGNKSAARRRLAREAVAALSQQDPRLGAAIERIGAFHPIITTDPFDCLASAILQQQISIQAAAAIQARLVSACGNGRRLRPAGLAALSPDQLRAVGISRQKARYLHALADAFATGRITAAGLRRMSDDEVVAAVTTVPGIGRWTAEMLLIFCLERPDIWPVDDLGLRHAVARFVGQKSVPSRRTMERLGARLYLWRFREGDGMPGVAVDR
jgi:DNA-3-methyladenine glycosylase II